MSGCITAKPLVIPFRGQLTDLYEVLGQVAKSVGWTVSAPLLLAELARRERDRKPFRVLHGEASAFRAWLDASKATPPLLDIEIIAVQPGVSVRRVDAWPQGRALLHAAVGWCDLEHVAFHLLASD